MAGRRHENVGTKAMSENGLRVLLNAEGIVPGGVSGGIEQFAMGLIRALGQLRDGPEFYDVLVHPEHPEWLCEYVGANQRIMVLPSRGRGLFKVLQRYLRGPFTPMHRQLRRWQMRLRGLHLQDQAHSLGAAVVHFLHPGFVPTRLPTVYSPIDLQHRHLPEFFTAAQRSAREEMIALGCRRSDAIVAISEWTRNDFARHYAVDAGRLHVIRIPPPTIVYPAVTDADLEAAARKFDLPEGFALYPAQTWPHKNHLRLLEAVQRLRQERNIEVPIVCTGVQNQHAGQVMACVRRLKLERLVRFLGFVPSTDLCCLYRLATFVVFPSLFEGGGLPLLEAFREGTPVACSWATSLPEYAGGAALLFDPLSTSSIAEALERMFADASLRQKLSEAGRQRALAFSWKNAAKHYRALYRKVAGAHLSEEDCQLLQASQSSDHSASCGTAA